MGKAINSEEVIIAKGEELSKAKGEQVTSWEIHAALGVKGNYQRLENIWVEHLKQKALQVQAPEFVLPEHAAGVISDLTDTLRRGVETLVQGVMTKMADQNMRQAAAMCQSYDIDIEAKSKELRHLKGYIGDLEAQVSELELAVERERARAALAEGERDAARSELASLQDQAPRQTHQDQSPASQGPARTQ